MWTYYFPLYYNTSYFGRVCTNKWDVIALRRIVIFVLFTPFLIKIASPSRLENQPVSYAKLHFISFDPEDVCPQLYHH